MDRPSVSCLLPPEIGSVLSMTRFDVDDARSHSSMRSSSPPASVVVVVVVVSAEKKNLTMRRGGARVEAPPAMHPAATASAATSQASSLAAVLDPGPAHAAATERAAVSRTNAARKNRSAASTRERSAGSIPRRYAHITPTLAAMTSFVHRSVAGWPVRRASRAPKGRLAREGGEAARSLTIPRAPDACPLSTPPFVSAVSSGASSHARFGAFGGVGLVGSARCPPRASSAASTASRTTSAKARAFGEMLAPFFLSSSPCRPLLVRRPRPPLLHPSRGACDGVAPFLLARSQ